MTGWEHFDHLADIGVRGRGRTQAEAFEQAALALTAVVTSLDRVRALERIEIQCEAPDRELLLVDWLNAVLREMSALKMLFSRFEVTLDGTRLTARLWGELADSLCHQPAAEVKGASYLGLKVVQEGPESWIAQCVVDV